MPGSGQRGPGLQGSQDLRGMPVGLHLRPRGGNPTIRPDEPAGADDPHVLAAVVHLLAPRAIALGHGVILVGEERERQAELGAEGRVAPRAVRADAPDRRVEPADLVVEVAELAGLGSAARGVVGRVEVDDRPLAAAVREAVDGAVLVGEGEVGGVVANGWHAHGQGA